MPTQPALDVVKAISSVAGELVLCDLAQRSDERRRSDAEAGGVDYTVVTTIYANNLATDMNPSRIDDEVSGLICQVDQTGDVVIAIRGTDGILEWIHDAEFLQVPCPFLAGAGHTEDGFTDMYLSLRTGAKPDSSTVVSALPKLSFPKPVGSVTICGHSLGGALATLLALDVAANTTFNDPAAYSYASPAPGIRWLQAPTTRWSRIRTGSPIASTSSPRCPRPSITSMCSVRTNLFRCDWCRCRRKSWSNTVWLANIRSQPTCICCPLQSAGPVLPLESACQPSSSA